MPGSYTYNDSTFQFFALNWVLCAPHGSWNVSFLGIEIAYIHCEGMIWKKMFTLCCMFAGIISWTFEEEKNEIPAANSSVGISKE